MNVLTSEDARPGCCQECQMGSPVYVPCNRPAIYMVSWLKRQEGPYRMCAACADHNVRNRGAVSAKIEGAVVTEIAIANAGPLSSRTVSAPLRAATDPSALVKEFLDLREYLSVENKRFAEHCRPHKERMETIRNLMLARANQESKNPHDAWSIRLDTGTAYRSTIMSPKVQDRDAFLDFIFGEEPHEEFLQLGAPQVDSVRDWMEAHEGKCPPGVEVSFNTTINIKKS